MIVGILILFLLAIWIDKEAYKYFLNFRKVFINRLLLNSVIIAKEKHKESRADVPIVEFLMHENIVQGKIVIPSFLAGLVPFWIGMKIKIYVSNESHNLCYIASNYLILLYLIVIIFFNILPFCFLSEIKF